MKTILALFVAVGFATAADRAPGLEVRIQSVNDLLSYADYFGGLAGQKDAAKQIAEMVKAFGGEKGVIEGVDLKKPIGAYAVFSPGLVDSQFVVLLPVADGKDFANLLKTRLNLDPKEEKDGSFKLEIPKVPVPVFYRMHKGYACFTIMDSAQVKPERMIDPDAFFKKKINSIIEVDLHIDRIPEEFRSVALSQLELKANDAAEGMKKGTAADRLGQFLLIDGGMKAAKCLLEECQTLSLRLAVEPKSDDISLSVSLVPKAGSDFAKVIKELPARPAFAALTANAENAVAAFALKVGLPESMKKDFAKKLDDALNEAVQNSGSDKLAFERLLEAIGPTLRAGDYEFGMAITGEERGKLRMVAALKAVEGKELEKLAKEFGAFIPEDNAKIEFDVAKLAFGNLHKITVKNDDLKNFYGNDSVYAAFGDSAYIVGFEPDGEGVKKLAAMKPGTADMMTLRVSVTRIIAMVDPEADAKLLKAAADAVYEGPVKPGADEISLTVRGGSELTVKLNAKGKSLAFLAKMTEMKDAK